MTTDELWNRARPRLLAVAVNILGSVILATSPDMKRGIVLEHIDGQITGIQIQQNQAKLNLD